VEVHLIMGQSNSLGRAHAYQLPAELQQPLQGCYIYNPGSGDFEPIQAGVNTMSDQGQFGPVVKAAQLLREHTKKDVYFVVAGYGNSQLQHSCSSQVLDWHTDSDELLAQSKQTIEQGRAALEADALDAAKAGTYQANEEALFASLDQVAYLRDTKRVVYKVFSDVESHPHAGTVNAAKAARAAADTRTVAVLETNGYDRIPQDRLHATARGQVQAGTDLFNAIKDIE
jgi:hypothetical protein